MDERSLADLSKRVAAAASRRRALAALAGGVAAAALGRPRTSEAIFGFCRAPGKPCGDRTQCCAGKCNGGVCGCLKKGKAAAVGPICCSGKVRRGKCK